MALDDATQYGEEAETQILPWGHEKGMKRVALPYIARQRASLLLSTLSLGFTSCQKDLGETRVLRAATSYLLHTNAKHKTTIMPDYSDRSGDVNILAGVLGSFSLLAVILRFVARSRTKARYGPDDWWAIASLVTLLAWMGVVIWSVSITKVYFCHANIVLSCSKWLWL